MKSIADKDIYLDQLGSMIEEAFTLGSGRLSTLAPQLGIHEAYAFGKAAESVQGVSASALLPLPLVLMSVEDLETCYQEHRLGPFLSTNGVWEAPEDAEVILSSLHAWVGVMTVSINFMYLRLWG